MTNRLFWRKIVGAMNGSDTTIRAYRPSDATALASMHNALYPEQFYTPGSFGRHLAAIEQGGGQVWVVGEGVATGQGLVLGYAAVSPVPGLAGVVDLEGGIAPRWQRQGLGGRLLTHLLNNLEGTVQQVSYCVASLDSPAARFLQRFDFFVEHEEWAMRLADLSNLPATGLLIARGDEAQDEAWRLRTYARPAAIEQFCTLYEESFGGTPWYQPYTATEVAASLVDAGDIFFLLRQDQPIGFAWTRFSAPAGEIEPIGIIKPYQGQGYGRILLLAALRHLAQRGAKTINIGAWRANQAAIHLYHSTGFHLDRTLIYLARNLEPPTNG